MKKQASTQNLQLPQKQNNNQQDDFFITGVLSNSQIQKSIIQTAPSTQPSTNRYNPSLPNTQRTMKIPKLQNNNLLLSPLSKKQGDHLQPMSAREFFTKRKLEKAKNVVDYLQQVKFLIKSNELHLLKLHSQNIKDFGQQLNSGTTALTSRGDDKKTKFYQTLYEKANIKKPSMKRAISQRRLTIEEKQKINQDINNNLRKSQFRELVKIDNQKLKLVLDRKINANQQLEEIKNSNQDELNIIFTDKSSNEIKEILKDFENIPHIQYGLKQLMDSKETELVKRRNIDLFKIKMYEKQLEDLKKALNNLEIQGITHDEQKIEQLKQQIQEVQKQKEHEKMQALILNYMIDRDKKNLLYEQDPVTKRKKKLLHYDNQIAQCRKDKKEYEKEVLNMMSDYKELVDVYVSKQISDYNELDREKHEAQQLNHYKQLYKMEKVKRAEEIEQREMLAKKERDENARKDQVQRMMQESLRIETQKTFEQKERQFKVIQQETLVHKVEDLPNVMDYYSNMDLYLENEIDTLQMQNREKSDRLAEVKAQLYDLMLKKKNDEQIVVNVKEVVTKEDIEMKSKHRKTQESRLHLEGQIINACGVVQKLFSQLKLNPLHKQDANVYQTLTVKDQNDPLLSKGQNLHVSKKNVEESLSLVGLKLQQLVIYLSQKVGPSVKESKQIHPFNIDMFDNDCAYLGIERNVYVESREEDNVVSDNPFMSNPIKQPVNSSNMTDQTIGIKDERDEIVQLRKQYMKKKGKL